MRLRPRLHVPGSPPAPLETALNHPRPLCTTGNHDGEADLSRHEIVAVDMAASNLSLTQQGPVGVAGASNYYVDVLDPQGGAVAARLWLLDSNDRGCGPLIRAGW